jgi:hypothetical protein
MILDTEFTTPYIKCGDNAYLVKENYGMSVNMREWLFRVLIICSAAFIVVTWIMPCGR